MTDFQNNALLDFSSITGGAEFLLTNWEISHQLEREQLISGVRGAIPGAKLIQAVLGLDQQADDFEIDAGQGVDTTSLSCEIVPSAGDPFIWTDINGIDRSGADRFAQAEVLQEAARKATADSENPAVLQWGPHRPGGPLDAVPVAVSSLTTRHPRDDPSRFTVDAELRRVEPGDPTSFLPP
jgi:hypothetical protein